MILIETIITIVLNKLKKTFKLKIVFKESFNKILMMSFVITITSNKTFIILCIHLFTYTFTYS